MKAKMPFKKSEDKPKERMMRIGKVLRGIVSGAAVMYFLDPQMGARRRALARDKMVKFFNRASERVGNATERAADRARGIAAETARRFNTEPISDEVMVARVRSEMGRYLKHPHAVHVTAHNGHITLTGDILAHEVQPLLNKLNNMQFVESIDNLLQTHADATNLPDLQGGETQRGTP